MTWFRADDMLADHPKVISLGRDAAPAMGLWLLVGTWAARYSTDGFVPDDMVRRYDPRRRLAKRLVEVGLWERREADPACGQPCGYRYHDWADFQLSAEEVEKKRSQNRERQRRHRERNGRFGAPPPGPGAGTPSATETAPDQAEPSDVDGRDAVIGTASNGIRNALHNASVTSTPTRPDPYLSTSRGNLGGGTTEPNARTINGSPPKRPRCERHQHLADDDPGPPCHGCRHARETAEATTAEADATRRRQRAEAAAIRDACDDCDEYGWALDHEGKPAVPARKCPHGRPLRSVS